MKEQFHRTVSQPFPMAVRAGLESGDQRAPAARFADADARHRERMEKSYQSLEGKKITAKFCIAILYNLNKI